MENKIKVVACESLLGPCGTGKRHLAMAILSGEREAHDKQWRHVPPEKLMEIFHEECWNLLLSSAISRICLLTFLNLILCKCSNFSIKILGNSVL